MPAWKDINEESVSSYLNRVSKGQAGVNPKAVTLSRSSNNPRAAAIGQDMVDSQLNQNQRNTEDAADVAQAQTRQMDATLRRNESFAKQRAAVAEADRKRAVRQAAAQGSAIKTDVDTGLRVVDTHDDGATKFKAGPIAGAPLVPSTQTTAVRDTQTNEIRPTPASNPLIPDSGALGATGGETRTSLLQPIRDDRGNESLVKPVTTTDKRGVEYVNKTDPVSGQPGKQAVGIDPVAQAKALKDQDIANRAAEVDLRANGVNQARLTFDELWKAVSNEYDEATKGYESLAKEPITRGTNGTWIKTDPNTGKVTYPAPAEVAIYNRRLAESKQRVANATKKRDEMKPRADNLDRNDREIKDAKLKLAEEKIRHDAGLPKDDGGIASILALSTGQIEPSEEQAAINEVVAVTGNPATNQQLGKPRKRDTSNPQAVLKAFSGLQGAEGMTLEPSTAGSFINKDGKWIGTITDGGANQKVIVLRDDARQDDEINKTVALGVTSGAPVYLRDNGIKKDVTKEAQETAALFQEIGQAPDQRTANAIIKQKGMDRQGILAKVNDGQLSIQTGEALLKHFYGDSLKSTPPDDPQAFNQWLAENSKGKTGETVATRWGNKTNLADKNEVKREYLRDWYQANRGKPGVTREAMRKLYGEDEADKATSGERVQSALKTGGRMMGDVASSMVGLAGKAAVGLGAAELALFSDDAKKIGSELLTMTNRDTANWTQTAKRNIKAWTTEEGERATMNFNRSVNNLQNIIDEETEKPQPDKARIAGAAQQASNAAMAMHALSPDEAWPITPDNLDPDKDPALGSALAQYVKTADPREMELYKERLLMSNGRRQFSADLEKKMAGMGRYGRGMIGGMYSGWQEVASEAVADAATLATGGAVKGLQLGLKGAGMAGKASRVARLAESIGEAATAFGKAGVRAESLVNPLTRGQKVANMAIQGGKALATGAIGEGGEEMLTEVGSDNPDFVQAFASGAIAPFALAPAQYLAARISSPERNAQAQLQSENARWAKNYNATMADVPGFKAVTPDQAMLARSFVDPVTFQDTVTELAIAKQRYDALESEPIAQSMAKAELDRATTDLAAQTQSGIDAANEIEAVEDPTQKAYYQGIAKVATGNEATLTTAERSAIAGGTTPDGSPLFAEVAGPDGQPRTVLTDEAKANLSLEMPAVGSLIRTTESDAILSSLGGQAPVVSPTNEQPSGIPADPFGGNQQPSQTGEGGSSRVLPQVAGRQTPAQVQAGGLEAAQPQSTAGQVSPAQLDAAEYSAYQTSTPNAPDIQTVVRDAFASGQPVSITMARAARQGPPQGYTKRGALLVPNPAQTTPQAKPEAKKAPSKVSNQTREVSGRLKAETERAIPGLKGRINVTDKAFAVPSGGVVANNDGTITIVLPDVEREIKGSNPKAVFKSLQQTIQRHEAVHVVQYEAVRDIWKQKGSKGDYGQFFQDWYGKIAAELPIEAIAKAREIYGAQAWDSIGSDANRAAELVRMLVEAKLDPTKADDFSELFRAVETGQNKTLIETIRQAIRVLTKLITEGKLSKEAQQHVEQITELYNALVAGGEASVTPVTNGTSERGGNTGADSAESDKSDARPDVGRADDAKDKSVEGSGEEKVLGQQTPRRKLDSPHDRAFYLNPVIDGIRKQGGMVSRTRGKELLGDRYEANKSQWDDAHRFANPTFNTIYSKAGRITPNKMADALFKDGVLPEPTANALWRAIAKAEKDANSFVRNSQDAASREGKGQREQTNEERFDAANQQTDDNTPLQVEDFTKESVGGTITVGGEPMRIMSVETNPLTDEVELVVLQDGTKFGRQVLESGETVFVEADQAEDGLFTSATQDINSAVTEARKELDRRRKDREQVSVKWDRDEDNFAEEGEERYFPDITLSKDDAYLKRFIPTESLFIDGKDWFYGDSRPFASMEEAMDYAVEQIASDVKEIAPSSTFGSDSDATEISANIFGSFPNVSSITKPWEQTKWGSWYLSFKDEEGNTRKISVRDHGATRADMGIPDKSFYVSKQWNPEEVGKALTEALDYIEENSNNSLGSSPTVEPSEPDVLASRVATAKEEIEADIKSGAIPPNVGSFSNLNDYVDANEYVNDSAREDRLIGPLGKRLGWKPGDYVDFTNKIIGELDKWLSSPTVDQPANEPLSEISKSLSKSPSQYEYENITPTTKISNILRSVGIPTIQSVGLGRTDPAIQEFEKRTGATIHFIKGGKSPTAGFVTRLGEPVIFVNADESVQPIGQIIAHELVHLAQMDPSIETASIYQVILKYVSDPEISAIENKLESLGYADEDQGVEIPAYFITDAVTGSDIIGFEGLTNKDVLRTKLSEFYENMVDVAPVEGGENIYESRNSPVQPDLFTAATAPDATQKLGQVKVGTMNALGAYRALTAKRERTSSLTAKEEEQLLAAETALGQKLAFDMEAVKGEAEAKPEAPKPTPPKQGPKSTQQSMMLGEEGKGGQMSLFSSPSGFYSGLERFVESKVSNNATPSQVMATIDPTRGSGVKAEEIKWTGIEQALERIAAENNGKVPKSALLNHLRNEGKVKFKEEVMLEDARENIPQSYLSARQEELLQERAKEIADEEGSEPDDEYDRLVRDPNQLRETMEQARDEWEEYNPSAPTQYEKYVLRGGENYREVVLTMPGRKGEGRYETKRIGNAWAVTLIGSNIPVNNGRLLSWEIPEGGSGKNQQDRARDMLKVMNSETSNSEYTSNHFTDIPNYVAHMRLDERNDSNGKPGLFIEEIQSDRHQQGRQNGYKGQVPTDDEVRKFFGLSPETDPTEFRQEMMEHPDLTKKGVADAPFRKDWQLQMFKRALRDAVESGKKWIGWTTGETQADRFDISKQISRVVYSPGPERLQAFDKSGKSVIDQTGVPPEKIEDYIGKEAAQRLFTPEHTINGAVTIHELRGEDLKVGGDGMKGFYDNILPKEIGKYVKQWDAKVEKSTIKIPSETPIWKVNITPEMEKGVSQGQPLFSSPSQDAADQALAGMPQIYRDVFQAVSSGKTQAEVMKQFNLREVQVKNILRAVETRMKVGVSAAAPGGIQPVTRDGKIMGGRPDLAGSTKPTSAAISQIRNEAGAPAREDFAAINAQAREVVKADPKGTLDRLAAKKERGESFTLEEVAQAKIITRETVLTGADNTPEMRAKLALFGVDFIEQGTDDARKLAIRFDPDLSPAERFAQYVGAELYVPPAKVLERLKGAKNKEEIIKSWMADVDATKDFLKAQGYDIDASLQAYRDRQTAQAEAAAESPRVQATIEDTISKLSKRDKTVVEAVRGGSTYEVAGSLQGMTKAEAESVYRKWFGEMKTALAESGRKFMANTLGSSPSEGLINQIMAELGVIDPDMVPKDEADKPRVKKLIDAAKPKKVAPAKPKKPTLVNPTPEAQAALDDAWEKFQNTTQSWKAFTKGLKLEPINETTGEYTEDRPFSGQGEFFREPINETQGTFDINDPVAQKEVAQAFSTRNASIPDKILEFWKASILSGPQTMIVNSGSNIMHAGYRLLPRRAAEAASNTLLSAVGLGSKESASFGEFAVMAKHLKQAAALAGRQALRSWNTEANRLFESYATALPNEREFGKTGLGQEEYSRAMGGPIGKVMNSISFRHMQAADEFVKFFAGQLEAAAQAHRIARNEEGLRGDAYVSRLNELLEPGSKAWIRAIDEAQTITFQNKLDGSKPNAINRIDQLAEIARAAKGKPYLGKALELFIPFISTPTNIFKQALEMSPLGAGLAIFDAANALKTRYASGKLTEAEAKHEAAKLYNKARFVNDMTNQILAVSAYYAVASMVSSDDDELPFMTGTQPFQSTKKGERDNAYAVMPPMSIRVGNTTASYARWEPFATVLASMADLAREIDRAGGLEPGVASKWIGGFKDQLTQKTFLQGLSNLAEAWDNPDRFGTNLASGIVTGFVPNLIRQPINKTDPYMRDTKPTPDTGFFEGIADSVGYSLVPSTAPLKYDVWGNPIKKNRGELVGGTRASDSALRIVDPTNLTVNPQIDKLDKWVYLYNLETANASDRLSITPISNRLQITVEGESKSRTITLTPKEYEEANVNAGKAARAALGDGWDKRPRDISTKELIETTVREAQRAERARLKMNKIAEGLPPLEK